MATPCPRRRCGAALSLLLALAGPALAAPLGDAAAVRRRFDAAPVWVVGERHRVAAGHRLFGDLVEGCLNSGETVRVGLEIPADRQPALERALGGGDPAVAPVVIDSPSYRRLLRRLGELAAGHPGQLQVVAIDAPDGSAADRDAHMATALLAPSAAGAPDRVLALVGNLHAFKEGVPGAGGRLAALLEARGTRVASLLQPGVGEGPGVPAAHLLHPASPRAAPALRRLGRLVAEAPLRRQLVRVADGVILRP